MEILTYPNPLLREEARKVHRDTVLTKEFRHKCWEMLRTMKAANGVGLAATQIGWDSSIFVMRDVEAGKYKILINPEWTAITAKKWKPVEGCLSVPNLLGNVERFYDIRVIYMDITGTIRHEVMRGVEAQCVQHETEHLEGIMFLDHKPELFKRS